ncbi:MAG: dihydropteroate synthase [Acidobacteriia bacterium]|nr:dihydropteroate synthase [Terriglobia bacterium]
MHTELHSRNRTVLIGADQPFVLIGERINPTGRKSLGAQMAAGDFTAVRRDAQTQIAAGARVLDVNAGSPLGDETVMLRQAVLAIQEVEDVPLCLDSSRADALEAALAIYSGKALVNSVTGEEARLELILPLIRKYRCAVIGLVSDDAGISNDPGARLAVARKIVERARDHGVPASDVILDPLCLAVATDPRSALVTFETMRRIRGELGVNLCCGASNVSFGLPDRAALTAAFLPMAMSCGLTSAIADITQPAVREAVLAGDLLCARDENAAHWLARYREKRKAMDDASNHISSATPDRVHA